MMKEDAHNQRSGIGLSQIAVASKSDEDAVGRLCCDQPTVVANWSLIFNESSPPGIINYPDNESQFLKKIQAVMLKLRGMSFNEQAHT